MTTRFECPKHGAMKPGQILHNGHTYTCSTCGQGLRANSEDTRDAEIVRLRAENAALAAHVERLRDLLENAADFIGGEHGCDKPLVRAFYAALEQSPETSIARRDTQTAVNTLQEAARQAKKLGDTETEEWLLIIAERRQQAEATS